MNEGIFFRQIISLPAEMLRENRFGLKVSHCEEKREKGKG
jgi:hypothetical protein